MEKKRIYVMSDDSMTNEIINIKYKRLMTQKKKNQNEQEVKAKATKSKRKSNKKEVNPQKVDLSVQEEPVQENPIDKNVEDEKFTFVAEEILGTIKPDEDCGRGCNPEYDAILAKFDKTLEEIDERFKSNEELTERLLKEHQECESFVDEFLDEED